MTARPRVQIEPHSATACIVTLRGEHDPSTIAELALVMNLASAYRYVLVDLSECLFLDSSVVKTLLQAAELAHERAGALEVVAVADSKNAVRRALEVMSIDTLVRVHPTRATGVASLDALALPRAPSHSLRATVEDCDEPAQGASRVLPEEPEAHKA